MASGTLQCVLAVAGWWGRGVALARAPQDHRLVADIGVKDGSVAPPRRRVGRLGGLRRRRWRQPVRRWRRRQRLRAILGIRAGGLSQGARPSRMRLSPCARRAAYNLRRATGGEACGGGGVGLILDTVGGSLTLTGLCTCGGEGSAEWPYGTHPLGGAGRIWWCKGLANPPIGARSRRVPTAWPRPAWPRRRRICRHRLPTRSVVGTRHDGAC